MFMDGSPPAGRKKQTGQKASDRRDAGSVDESAEAEMTRRLFFWKAVTIGFWPTVIALANAPQIADWVSEQITKLTPYDGPSKEEQFESFWQSLQRHRAEERQWGDVLPAENELRTKELERHNVVTCEYYGVNFGQTDEPLERLKKHFSDFPAAQMHEVN